MFKGFNTGGTIEESIAAMGRVRDIAHASPEAIAHAFGVRLQREFGSDWARLIGIAAAAAMAADHADWGE